MKAAGGSASLPRGAVTLGCSLVSLAGGMLLGCDRTTDEHGASFGIRIGAGNRFSLGSGSGELPDSVETLFSCSSLEEGRLDLVNRE